MLQPGSRIDRYEIVAPIGGGGMGMVYQVRHAGLGSDHAMKVLLPNYAGSEKVRARFRQEAQIQSRLLNHPGIVRVSDLLEAEGILAMVMDLVPGPSLEHVLVSELGGPWALEATARVMWPVLEAMAGAHHVGVAHRDLKPANVLLDRSAGQWPGTPRVTDFGLAKLLASEGGMTKTGAMMGTLPYMAPEQFRGLREVDARADVFALGMMLWRLLSGRLPVDPDDMVKVAFMYAGHEPVPRLDSIQGGISEALASVVATCLEVDMAARPPDAASLRSQLMACGFGAASAPAVQPPSAPVPQRVSSPPTRLESPSEVTPAVQPSPAAGPISGVQSTRAVTPAPTGGSPWWRSKTNLALIGAALVAVFVMVKLSGRPDSAATAGAQAAAEQAKHEATEHLAARRAAEQKLEAERAARQRLEDEKAAKEVARQRRADGSRRPGKAGVVWVGIAGGTFQMGSNDGDEDEKPVHRVTVSSFEMARSEVTFGQYAACVKASACTPAHTDDGTCYVWDGSTWKHGVLPRSFRGADQPAVCVDWHQAVTFSRWVGGRLPTEAEWEYAARSGGRSWSHPWGNEKASCVRAVMDDGSGNGCGRGNSTWAVCSKSGGHTRQGLCDMIGNVWEWASDWHGAYGSGHQRDPKGPAGGSGGKGGGCGWGSTAADCRAAVRGGISPSNGDGGLGFRPSRSIP